MPDKKPSALILYHFFYPDDVVSAQHFTGLAEELEKRGWDIKVLTSNRYCRYPEKDITSRKEEKNGISIYRIWRPKWDQSGNYMRILNSLWMMAGWFVKALRLTRSDVVIIGTDPQFSALLFPVLRALRRGKKMVHWCFDLYPEAIVADKNRVIIRWLSKSASFFMKRAYKSVDLMVDIGSCMKRRLHNYKHEALTATLVPWALVEPDCLSEPDREIRQELFGNAKLALFYSGNMGKAHDFSSFLKLAKLLLKKDGGIVFTFACRGNRAKELMEAVKPDDYNVRFAPFVNVSDLEKRLIAADFHLLSLRQEWEGIVVPSKFFGSLAAGRPVIYAGPENSAIAEWIKEFNIGLILTKNNVEKIADELLNIADNRDKLLLWQNNAFAAYHDFFSKKRVADSWDLLLREAIGYRL